MFRTVPFGISYEPYDYADDYFEPGPTRCDGCSRYIGPGENYFRMHVDNSIHIDNYCENCERHAMETAWDSGDAPYDYMKVESDATPVYCCCCGRKLKLGEQYYNTDGHDYCENCEEEAMEVAWEKIKSDYLEEEDEY